MKKLLTILATTVFAFTLSLASTATMAASTSHGCKPNTNAKCKVRTPNKAKHTKVVRRGPNYRAPKRVVVVNPRHYHNPRMYYSPVATMLAVAIVFDKHNNPVATDDGRDIDVVEVASMPAGTVDVVESGDKVIILKGTKS